MEHKCHTDTVTSMLVHPAKKILIVTSGDGTISAFNVRAKRLELQSEEYGEEFTSAALVRSDTKLVTTTNKGMAYMFDWDKFGYHSATFGHSSSCGIGTSVAVGDKTVICAHDDGVLR
jgi:WD40 repeat protein